MPFLVEVIGVGLVLPAIVSLAVLWLAARTGGTTAIRKWSPVALGGAFLAAYTLFPWAPWFPEVRESWQWLAWIVLLGTITGVADPFKDNSTTLWRCLLLGAFSWFVIPTSSTGMAYRHLHLAVLTGGILLLGATTANLGSQRKDPLLPLLLSAVAFSEAFLIQCAGIAKFAQLAAVMATALAGVAAFAWWKKEELDLSPAMPLLSAVLVILLYMGSVRSGSKVVPFYCFLLLGAAPLFLTLLDGSERLKQSKRTYRLLSIVVILVPIAVAVAIAWNRYTQEPQW